MRTTRRFLSERLRLRDSAIFIAREEDAARAASEPRWSSARRWMRGRAARSRSCSNFRAPNHLSTWYAKLGFERDGAFELAGWSD
ncbi:MAG: hypothetical protein M3R43_12540 [Acidobacteriota bacterium]|nr:hypothetical protein [Acidobacteriota bacterium]